MDVQTSLERLVPTDHLYSWLSCLFTWGLLRKENRNLLWVGSPYLAIISEIFAASRWAFYVLTLIPQSFLQLHTIGLIILFVVKPYFWFLPFSVNKKLNQPSISFRKKNKYTIYHLLVRVFVTSQLKCWLLRFEMCHPFRWNCASCFGLNCATKHE